MAYAIAIFVGGTDRLFLKNRCNTMSTLYGSGVPILSGWKRMAVIGTDAWQVGKVSA